MSKARVLVTENILLFKYQKQAAKAALNERCPYIVTYCLRENREYTKSFAVVETLHRSRKKFLIGNFTGVPMIYFSPDSESEIIDQSGLQTNS